MESNYNKKSMTGVQGRLLNIVIVCLSIILAVLIVMTVAKFTEEGHYDYSVTSNDLVRTIKNGYYADAVQDMHANIVQGETVEKDSGYAIPYALAEYYEAASIYYAYTKAAGLPDNASRKTVLEEEATKYSNKMESAYKNAGDLAFITESIDKILDTGR